MPTLPLHIFHINKPTDLWIKAIELAYQPSYVGWEPGFSVTGYNGEVVEAVYTGSEWINEQHVQRYMLNDTVRITIFM